MCYNESLARYIKAVAKIDPEVADATIDRSVKRLLSLFSDDTSFGRIAENAVKECECNGGEERKKRKVTHAAATPVSEKLAQLIS